MTRKNAETKRATRAAKKLKTGGGESKTRSRSRSKSKRDASSPADAGASSEIGEGVSNAELDALWNEADAAHLAAEAKPKKARAKSSKRAKGASSAAHASPEAPKPTLESADTESGEAVAAARPEVDPSKLKPEDLRKRVSKVYVLERQVERCRAAYDLSRRHFNGAKRALAEAEEQLEQEIRDQRYGPGPLFSPDGQGAAAAPTPEPSSAPSAGQDDGLSSVENEFETSD